MDGGCVLYYRENLRVLHRNDLNQSNIEAIWVEVKFPSTTALLSVVHRPPDSNDFFENFNTVLERAWLKSANIFLLGDFNCNVKYSLAPAETSLQNSSTKLHKIFEMFNMQNIAAGRPVPIFSYFFSSFLSSPIF